MKLLHRMRARIGKDKDSVVVDQVGRFDDLAERYLEELDANLKYAGGDSLYFYRSKVNLIKRLVTVDPQIILDFGCGVGVLSRLLASAFPSSRVIGVDPSPGSIQAARSRHSSDRHQLAFFDRLDEVDGSPDMVVAAGVFHHVPPTERAPLLKQIFDRLPIGGSLVVFEHNPISPFARLIVAGASMDKGVGLIYHWRMRALMREAGFDSLRVDFISFFPPYFGALLRIESYLKRVPLSSQYMAVGSKSRECADPRPWRKS